VGQGDAALTDAYEGAVVADLLLLCGVFGNVTDEDVETTASNASRLCAPGAVVIWTRHRRPPDLSASRMVHSGCPGARSGWRRPPCQSGRRLSAGRRAFQEPPLEIHKDQGIDSSTLLTHKAESSTYSSSALTAPRRKLAGGRVATVRFVHRDLRLWSLRAGARAAASDSCWPNAR
jgi:hypothetical protein